MINQQAGRQASQEPIMTKPPKPKEKTAREKAMDFAKNNVPKPKVKPQQDSKPENTLNRHTEEDEAFLADHLFNNGFGSGKGITDR